MQQQPALSWEETRHSPKESHNHLLVSSTRVQHYMKILIHMYTNCRHHVLKMLQIFFQSYVYFLQASDRTFSSKSCVLPIRLRSLIIAIKVYKCWMWFNLHIVKLYIYDLFEHSLSQSKCMCAMYTKCSRNDLPNCICPVKRPPRHYMSERTNKKS